MSDGPLDRARRVARRPAVVRSVGAGGAVMIGTRLLRRSRLARLAAAGGALAYAGARRGGRSAVWHDVPRPDDRER
jgi:hypothetical protein